MEGRPGWRIRLAPASGVPLYRQLAQEIAAAIGRGRLGPGEPLPPSRRLAEQLGVSRITVTQAYEALRARGLVEAVVGRGTFVSGQPPAAPAPARPTPTAARLGPSGTRELLRGARPPGVISFAEGTPPEGLAALGGVRAALRAAIDEPAALGYEDPVGYLPLRRTLAGLLQEVGIEADPEEILITSGTQQAIYLAASQLAGPGDPVLVESPSFVGALGVLAERGARLVEVPLDGRGLRVAEVDLAARRYRPGLLFVQPTFQNPTGQVLPPERRQRLLELAQRHGLTLLEDDAYRSLAYGSPPPPPLRALTGAREQVIYLSSFSQLLLPGLRLGYMVAPPAWLPAMRRGKELLDLHSPGLIQRAAHRYLTQHDWRADLERIRSALRERRDAVVRALEEHLAGRLRWTVPEGGLFLWLEGEGELDGLELVRSGLAEGVLTSPGELFYPGGRRSGAVRLNFGLQPPELAGQGIARLARAVERLAAAGQERGPQPQPLPLL